jgi:hypothetical protein
MVSRAQIIWTLIPFFLLQKFNNGETNQSGMFYKSNEDE